MKRLLISLAALPLAVVIGILVPSAASAASPVQGLANCSPGPGCHYGPVHNSYPNYLSVCSRQDCTFVAAANLVQITTGLKTSAASLKADYAQAGQTYGGGLGMGALWSYWTNVGIDGVQISAVKLYPRDKADLENEVLGFRALIIEMALGDGSYLGATRFSAGTALMVVDGYTPKGPLIVYQDRTIQMTWAQWASDAKSMWGVTTSMVAPAPAPPPPPPSTAPTATLSLSTSSVPAAGATVTLTYSSTNATNCTLASSPSLWATNPATVSCSGTYQLVVPTSTAESQWTFTFTATSAAGQSAISTQTLTQAAPTVTAAANTSPNWSGYVVPSSSALITDAQGDFTVPTLNCADTPNGDSSTWVGIGGEEWSSTSSSGTLLQTGANSNCVNGAQENYAWFEMYPSQPNDSVEFKNFPVATGDQIQVSVYQAASGAWVTLVSDVNTGLSGIMLTGGTWGVGPTSTIHTTGWTVQGSTAALTYSGGYTAEWITEDPGVFNSPGALQPFANFSSVTWTNLMSSFTTWSLTQSETWAIVQNGVTLAAPISTSTDSFTDTYLGP
jgi:hypothetical protein